LSSGQRINRASDDAAGLAIADSLNAQSRIFNQGVRNLNDGLSLLSIADSAIENLSDIAMRLEELAEQAANGVYTNKQRNAMDDEAQALSKEFFRISKATEFNGQRLLTGEFDTVNLQGGVGERAVLSAGVGGAIGTGNFGAASFYSGVVNQVGRVANSDFNGDGILDIVVSNYGGGSSRLLLGRGDGSFSTQLSFIGGGFGIAVADFNGDGNMDVAGCDSGGSSVGVTLGTGNGSFASRISSATGASPQAIASGDINGDGFVDLVTGDYLSSTVSVLLGRGNSTFASPVAYAAGSAIRDVCTGDFNGDGALDVVATDANSNAVSVLLGRGNGTLAPRVTYTTDAGPWAVTSGDFNGDGKLDIATANYGAFTMSVLLGNGNGTFVAQNDYATGQNPWSIATGDFNGDGAMDIVTADRYSFELSVFIGKGSGTFNPRVSYATGSEVCSLSTGDLNSDGVLDLVTAEFGANTVSVRLGFTKDGVAPLLPFSLQTLADARQALPVFQRKREQLAMQRGEIGAFQSRIDVARSVLEVSSENFKAAESRIRDSDIADESSRLVRLNILKQAASSILAQANQQPALALQLLART
jgi:flagellin-like hook-associated protein FlgL